MSPEFATFAEPAAGILVTVVVGIVALRDSMKHGNSRRDSTFWIASAILVIVALLGTSCRGDACEVVPVTGMGLLEVGIRQIVDAFGPGSCTCDRSKPSR